MTFSLQKVYSQLSERNFFESKGLDRGGLNKINDHLIMEIIDFLQFKDWVNLKYTCVNMTGFHMTAHLPKKRWKAFLLFTQSCIELECKEEEDEVLFNLASKISVLHLQKRYVPLEYHAKKAEDLKNKMLSFDSKKEKLKRFAKNLKDFGPEEPINKDLAICLQKLFTSHLGIQITLDKLENP